VTKELIERCEEVQLAPDVLASFCKFEKVRHDFKHLLLHWDGSVD